MSKHLELTKLEFSNYSPHGRTLSYVEKYVKLNGLEKEQVNLLDWGCGRGRDTLWFKNAGYNAFGVDLDSEPICNGRELFKLFGHEDSSLRQLSVDVKTDFPDNFFHIIISNHVFEHVRDINAVIKETGRITNKGGIGFHRYPARRHITERHLKMPFVHWLPKNHIRKFVVYLFVFIGRHPNWQELRGRGFQDKVNTYYLYSNNKTFYRKHTDVRNMFERSGFRVSFETMNHAKVGKYWFLRKLASYRFFQRVFNYFLLTFKRVEILSTKL